MEKKIGNATGSARLKEIFFGRPRNLQDPTIFHRISLIAFLAWVGLGADGLSSSAYGPDEAFRALGQHAYLAIGLALATAFTVFVISYAYSRIVENFPYGGGGYIVATKLLGPRYGVISGAALLVDYVLTISVSIASGADQIFSLLSPSLLQYKLVVVAAVIGLLTILNLRGVKESVTILTPIFLIFLLAHFTLILGGIATHLFEAGAVVSEIRSGAETDIRTIGFMGIAALFVRAYSMGAGTYTGIEAVSNGIQIMREPKVETARRTMAYMALSLTFTAGGILLCYLLFHASPETGKTMNAVLLERFAGNWRPLDLPLGRLFVVVALASEAALLFVAAQTGFIDGPRVMSNMSLDSWLPHRFSSLSNRLTMQNGVVLIASAAIATLLYTKGNTSTLVLMYSINVFLTFSLSEVGMVRYWIQQRTRDPEWSRHIVIHVIGLCLCLSILFVSLYEKFGEGGWITLLATTGVIGLCYLIKRHYTIVKGNLGRLDEILTDIPPEQMTAERPVDPSAATAVILVSEFGGLGIHTLLTIQRLFPNHFRNFLFVSISLVDAGTLKERTDVQHTISQTEDSLKQYVAFAKKLGLTAAYRMGVGIDVLDELEKLTVQIAREFPRSIFFSGKLVFERDRWYQRFLHNETGMEFQRRAQFAGLNAMVLPIRVFDLAKKVS